VARQYPDTPFLWPVHPNPHVKEALDAVELPPNVLTRGPLRYAGFIEMLASAKAVLTDSGGVIEEACTLGVPTVIARDKTERPEAVECAMATLAGKSAEGVVEGFAWAFREPFVAFNHHNSVFGDAYAAERIVDLLT
jgi:UDP-N-acetylglucosamine 2-epimerase (non-hydrolysing)